MLPTVRSKTQVLGFFGQKVVGKYTDHLVETPTVQTS